MKFVVALALLSLLCLAYVVQAEENEDVELDQIADLASKAEEEVQRQLTKRWDIRIPTPRIPTPRIRLPRVRLPRIRLGK